MSRASGGRGELVRVAQELHRRGWVANHDGNVTCRLASDRFLATPTATSKAQVTERLLVELDGKGAALPGGGKVFGEIGLHLAVYAGRRDVTAVVHAHPPHATALAVAGASLLERPFLAEAVVSLGPRIPTVPFAPPGALAASALATVVAEVDAVLLANHGAMAWGASLEQALLRLELVEHLARIASLAQAVGGVRPLPDDALAALLEARAKAGLGLAASRTPRPVVACAPAPHAAVTTVSPGGEGDRLAGLIREEIARALREG